MHFCALTNSSFRGHEDDDSFFQQLADLRAKDDSKFQQFIGKKQKTYLHKDIQNELLSIMANKLLREDILKPIQQGFLPKYLYSCTSCMI